MPSNRDDVVEGGIASPGARAAAPAVFQIGAHTQVRKQARLLEDVAQGAPVGGQEDPLVLPDLAVDDQTPVRHPLQPGNGTQHRGLARAGMAEERGDPLTRQRQVDVQGKTRVGQLEAHLDHRPLRPELRV